MALGLGKRRCAEAGGACGTAPELFHLRKLMGTPSGGRDGDMKGTAETDTEKARRKEILRPEKENKKNKRRGGKKEGRLGKKPRERQRTADLEMEREGWSGDDRESRKLKAILNELYKES